MTLQDMGNAFFQVAGGCMVWLNVRQLWLHKHVRGIHWLSTCVYTVWGFWNLYFYSHLSLWASFWGGMLVVSGNLTWVCLLLHFRTKRTEITL